MPSVATNGLAACHTSGGVIGRKALGIEEHGVVDCSCGDAVDVGTRH